MINDIEEVEILDVDTSGDFLDQEEAEEAVSQFPDTSYLSIIVSLPLQEELNNEADDAVDLELDSVLPPEQAPVTKGFFQKIAESIFLSA